MTLNCENIWLQKGSSGSQVRELQTLLKSHNYYPYKIDGRFGYYTREGVKTFQRQQKNLVVDGIFGKLTCQRWKKVYPDATTTNTNVHGIFCSNVTIPVESERKKYGWKYWDDTNNLTKSGSKAHCTRLGTPIAGKNGTYHTPAPLTLKGFDFNSIPDGSNVDKVIVHYSQNKSESTKNTYPAFTGAKFTLLGINKTLTGVKVSIEGESSTLTFTGVTLEDLKNTSFGLKIEYPKNGNTNPGRLHLWNVYLEVITQPASVEIVPTIEPSISPISIVGNIGISNIAIGELFNVKLTLSKDDKTDYSPKCYITLPSQIQFVKKVSTDGLLTEGASKNTYIWTGSYHENSCELEITCKALEKGSFNIEILEESSQTSQKIPVSVLAENLVASSTLNSSTNNNIIQNQVTKYTIGTATTNLNRTVTILTIKLPNSIDGKINSTEIINSSDLIKTYNADILYNKDEVKITLKVPLTKKQTTIGNRIYSKVGTIPLEVKFKEKGYFVEQIYWGSTLKNSISFVVKSSKHTQLGFLRIPVPQETIDLMGDGIQYAAISLARYVSEGTSKNIIITDYKRNLRFGIYNHSNDYIQIDREGADYIEQKNKFLEYVQFSNIINNKMQEHRVDFTYHEQNPLYYVWVYEYITSENYGELNVEFTDPVMIEKKYYTSLEKYGLFLKPVDSLLDTVNDSSCELDSLSKTNMMIFDIFTHGGVLTSSSFICIGIEVLIDYTNNSQCEALMTLQADENNKGYRSIIIPEGSGTLTIGGKYDLFGLTQKQLKNHMDDIEFQMRLVNPFQADSIPELNNLRCKFHYINLEQMGSGFTVNGMRNEYMGLFFEDFTLQAGTDNDVKYYKTNGTDTTTAYRSNIKTKEIELKCRINGCTLDESEALLENVVKIFQNHKDKFNRPIEKTIWFDHSPDYEYLYIMEDAIKAEPEHGEYAITIKLTVPSGTAQSRYWTMTADTGANNGIAPVYPEIYLVAKKNKNVELTETVQSQHILIESDNIQKDDLIIITHKPRRVLLKRYNKILNPDGSTTSEVVKTIDITKDVDFTSTWFYLMGEYKFTSSNAIISKIMFKERW